MTKRCHSADRTAVTEVSSHIELHKSTVERRSNDSGGFGGLSVMPGGESNVEVELEPAEGSGDGAGVQHRTLSGFGVRSPALRLSVWMPAVVGPVVGPAVLVPKPLQPHRA